MIKTSTCLLLITCISLLLSGNWSCTLFGGDDLSIRLDSLNNPLLHTIDAFAVLQTDNLADVIEDGFCWNQTGSPTIADSIVAFPNPAIREINATVGQFSPAQTYFLRAFARTSKKLVYSETMSFTTWDGTLTDADGNQYVGIQIANQGWMAENLHTTSYADGSPIAISNGTNRTYWYGSGHTYSPNFDQDIDQDGDFDAADSLLYVNEYGLLYSWYAANNMYDHTLNTSLLGKKVYPGVRDVCPYGWHLPSGIEFQTLRNNLASIYGYEAYAHHLTTTTGWADNLNGLDTYHFALKPGAYWHEPTATHTNILKREADLWTADEGNDSNGGYVSVNNVDKRLYGSIIGKAQHALCIRCIKNK